MKEARKKHASSSGRTIAFALVIWAFLPHALFARQLQTAPKQPVDTAANRRARAMVDAINQRGRELGLIAVTEDDDQAAFVRRRLNAQLSEDFEKLYSINVEKIAAQLSASSFDYKALWQATADLKNRATRIKYNVPILNVAAKGDKIRYDENPDVLDSMLAQLSGLIKSFLGSPVFRINSPDDLELRSKAGRELDGIIKLSDTISKIAKRSIRTTASR